MPESDGLLKAQLKRNHELRTPQLNKLYGEEKFLETKRNQLDIRKLKEELNRIYGRQRALRHVIKGPLSVREYLGPFTGQNHARINVEDNEVVVGNRTIPNIWLRDNCQCSSCMHDSTKQRLQDTFAIPKDLSIKSASLTKEKDVQQMNLEIVWSDGHESRYTQPFLAKTLESYDRRSIVRQGLTEPKLWDSSIASDPPIELFETESIGTMLENIVSTA